MHPTKILISASALGLATLTGAALIPAFASQQATPQTSQLVAQRPPVCPQIRQAKASLNDAINSLSNANRDYSGHRAKALAAARTALDETNQALSTRDCQ